MIGRWLDKLFDAFSSTESLQRGQGLDSNTVSTWDLPAWIPLLCLVIGATITAYAVLRDASRLRRRWTLAGIRICLIALVLLMMHGWIRFQYRTNLPDLLVLIDNSQSMQASDSYGAEEIRRAVTRLVQQQDLRDTTRANILKATLLRNDASLLKFIRQHYTPRVYLVGRSARRLTGKLPQAIRDLSPDEPASYLGGSLRQALQAQRGRSTAGVLYFTDGNNTAGPSLTSVAEYAKQRAIPLIFVGTGSQTIPTDMRISDLYAQSAAFVDDLVHFDVQVTADGKYPVSFKTQVELRERGNAEVFDRKTISISRQGGTTTVRLTHRPSQARKWNYLIRVVPGAFELNPQNNQRSHPVDVKDETIRVLLAQEYPSPEFRFLKSALGRQTQRGGKTKAIALTTVLQEADLEYVGQDNTARRTLPLKKTELFQYDVIIFGDVNRTRLSDEQLTNLASFVNDRGGGLIVMAGPRHTPMRYRGTPLARLLPVRLANAKLPASSVDLTTGFQVTPTTLGLATPALQLGNSPAATKEVWSKFPQLFWFLETPEVMPGARVLVAHPTRRSRTGQAAPLISMQVVGAGKVVFHAIDSTYRWSRSDLGSEYYQRYWLQTIRYLSQHRLLGKTRQVLLTTDQERYLRGDDVRIQARFLDDGLTPDRDDGTEVTLRRLGGVRRVIKLRRQPVNPNVFEAEIGNLSVGDYQIQLTAPALTEPAGSRTFSIQAPAGEDRKQPMNANELRLAAEKTAGRFLTVRDIEVIDDALPTGQQVRIESLPAKPIWNSALFAILFVVLLVTDWALRKQGGLS